MKRQSVDQKQVLHHRNVEDERHRLQSALTDVEETASSDVDNNDDIPASPSSSQPVPDNERVNVESVISLGNSDPAVIPNDGMYHLLTLFNGIITS